MANTTDILITSLFDEEAIEYINQETGLDLKQVTNADLCGGPKVVAFEAYATCQKSVGKERLNRLMRVFNRAPFASPEFAVMLIDDDEGFFNNVVTRF